MNNDARNSLPDSSTVVNERHTLGEVGEQDATGVDLSLLRWMLQQTPLQRLSTMEKYARDTEVLLEHGRRHRQAEAVLLGNQDLLP